MNLKTSPGFRPDSIRSPEIEMPDSGLGKQEVSRISENQTSHGDLDALSDKQCESSVWLYQETFVSL
jgi:hypothetical protein